MLERGKYYHIFNKGFGGQNIFIYNYDYLHFIDLMNIFLFSVTDVYAYALLGNHFHFAVKIKSIEEVGFLNSELSKTKDMALKWKTFSIEEAENIPARNLKIPDPDYMLQHLFDTYARWFNKKHERKGKLLEKSYKIKEVDNTKYLQRIVLYIHNNPVKHGFCSHPVEYGWTSYISFVRNQSTRVKKDAVLKLFENYSEFISLHNKTDDDFFDMDPLIIE